MAKWVVVRALTMQDRQDIVDLYLRGEAINRIAHAYNINNATVRYHLVQAGVFIPGRRPTVRYMFHSQVSIISHNTQTRFVKKQKDMDRYLWGDNEKNFPKSYEEYLQRSRDLRWKQLISRK